MHCCLGSAPFRTYQHWPHLLAALFCKIFNVTPSFSVHFLWVSFWILHIPVFYVASRWLRIISTTSFFIALVSPLIASVIITGHELASYAYAGNGLYTQVVASPFFLLFLALTLRTFQDSGWGWRRRVALGVLLSLTFLLHHFYGYMALLALAALSFGAVAQRRVSLLPLFSFMGSVGMIFIFISGYQLLSIFQDAFLAHQNTWYSPERWNGIGWAHTAEFLGSNGFLDFQRFPFFTILTVVGGIEVLRLRKNKSHRIFIWSIFFGFFFLIGRDGLGGVFDVIPGTRLINPERFIIFVHLGAIFLAGFGLKLLWDFGGIFPPGLRRKGAALFFVIVPLGSLYTERIQSISSSRERLESFNPLLNSVSGSLLQSLEQDSSRGYFWSRAGQQETCLGPVPYAIVLSELGIRHLAAFENSHSYGAETPTLFEPNRRSDYELFNITHVLLPVGQAADFLSPRLRVGAAELYRVTTPGWWDVVSIPEVQKVKDEWEFRKRVEDWLRGPQVMNKQYRAFVPEKAARKIPESVPVVSETAEIGGGIESSTDIENGISTAVLSTTSSSAYGLLRTSYHPHWKIECNGKELVPQWIGPAYIGFPLEKGTNHVTASFTRDPLRHFLFWVGLLGLIFFLVTLSYCKLNKK